MQLNGNEPAYFSLSNPEEVEEYAQGAKGGTELMKDMLYKHVPRKFTG